MLPHNYQNIAQFNKYVAEYKDLLDQQIANNNLNYDQNMLYIKTGVQISELPDQRSLDEKMLDTNKILSELRPKLMTITDGVYTSQILNQLQNNQNLLRFVYNSWPRIETYMKANFARGVTALIFMNYINEQVKVTTKEIGQSPFHIFRPKILQYSQQFLNDIINKGDVIRSKKGKALYNVVVADLKERIRLYDELMNESNNLFEMMQEDYDINSLIEMSETSQMEKEDLRSRLMQIDYNNQEGVLRKWQDIIENPLVYQTDNESEFEQILNVYRDVMIVDDDLPLNDIRRLIKLMRDVYAKKQSNKERELPSSSKKVYGESVQGIFSPKLLRYSEKFLDDIVNKSDLIKTQKGKKLYNEVVKDLKNRNRLYEDLINESINLWEMTQEDFDINALIELGERNQMEREDLRSQLARVSYNLQQGTIQKWENIIKGKMISNVNSPEDLEKTLNMYRDLMIINDGLPVYELERLRRLAKKVYEEQRALTPLEQRQERANLFKDDKPKPKRQREIQDEYNTYPGETTGKGLAVRTPRQPRVKIEGKVQKPPLYIPLGKNIINRNDLNKGVLKIRGASGGALVGFDTQAISGDLSEILKQIANGDIPSDSVLDSLDNEDKQLLHKIISKSRLDDKIKVKDINHDKIDREYRRYLLLRGEVLAGNTNYELIKELKRAILKLTHDGRLPKAQSAAALQELAILDL